jgi:hypothetical protein
MLPSYPYLILALYPQLSFSVFTDGQILLQDDGNGPYIAAWGSPLPEPTTEQLYSDANQLAAAKMEGEVIITAQATAASNQALAKLDYSLYISQAALPEPARLPQYQAAIEANNAIAIETANRQAAVDAATTVEEVNAIVYPSQSELA